MSYHNLVNQACSDNAEAFQRLRDFLCKRDGTYDYSTTGIGWTLHDAVYATDEDNVAFNDYFVAYSPGEDGDQDIYLKVTYASGYINCHLYLYWDATTHAGVRAATTNNNWIATNSSTMTLWIYGDLDAIVLFSKIGTTYYGCFAIGHCPDSQFNTGVATSASSVSSGSSVVVTVDAVPEDWAVGQKIFIRDPANIERVIISAISGNDVTLTTVVASYWAGCKLQREVSSMADGSTYFLSAAFAMIDHAGTKASGHNIDACSGVSGTTTDGLTSGSPLSLIFYYTTTSLIGPFPHFYRVVATGRTVEGTETDSDGVTYRCFAPSSTTVLVKEV